MISVSEAISFGDRTAIGVDFESLTIDFCKTMSGDDVSQTDMEFIELGVGKYVIVNPNITARTVVSGFVKGNEDLSFSVMMDPIDGNIADATTTNIIHDHTHTLMALALFQNGMFAPMGNMHWVDGANGNDTTGTGTQALPYATIGKALSVAVDGERCTILVLGKNSSYDEQLIMDKSHVALIGSGSDCWIEPSSPTAETFKILAHGCVVSGFGEIKNTIYNPITVDGVDDVVINKCLISGDITASGQNGILFNNSSYSKVMDCHVHKCGLNGILETSNANDVGIDITETVSHSNVGNGIQITGSQSKGTIGKECNIFLNGGYGVSVGGMHNTITNNHIMNNSAGDIVDVGTSNQIENNEQWAQQEGLQTFFMRLMASMKNKIIGN